MGKEKMGVPLAASGLHGRLQHLGRAAKMAVVEILRDASTALRLVAVLLLALAGGPVAHATPLTYFVTFTGGPTLPAVGLFTYDDAVSKFSNFLVFWDGTAFDLTSAANAPFVSAPCPGESSSPATGFALMSQSLCAGSVYNWFAGNTFGQQDFGFQVGGGLPNRQLFIADFNVPGGDPTPDQSFGSWTLSPGTPATFNYIVNFTGGPTLPALGVFAYDAATQEFDNFLVFWNGTVFDLTSAANAPFVSAPCPGESSSPATGFALMNQSLCTGSVYNWFAGNTFGQQDFGFQVGGGLPNRQLFIADFNVPGGGPFPDQSFGTWTLTSIAGPGPVPPSAVPEPSTIDLLWLGLLGFVGWRMRGARDLRPA